MKHQTLGALVAVTLGFQAALAADPKTLVVGFGPGGTSSIAAQHIADALRATTGLSTIVKNVPGVGGRLAADEVVRSASHEEILFMSSTSTLRVPPTLNLVSIGIIATYDFVAVVRKSAPPSLDEYMRASRSDDSLRNVASAGAGSVAHLVGEQLFRQHGAKAQHIPFRGSAEAIVAVLSGAVAMAIVPRPDYRASGDLQILASTGNGIQIGGWMGIYAPPGTSAAEASRLADLFRKASERSESKLREVGFRHEWRSGDELRRLHERHYKFLKPIADELGITL